MSIMRGLRAYHAILGLLVIAAFLTGELGTIHAVLGYAITVIIGGAARCCPLRSSAAWLIGFLPAARWADAR